MSIQNCCEELEQRLAKVEAVLQTGSNFEFWWTSAAALAGLTAGPWGAVIAGGTTFVAENHDAIVDTILDVVQSDEAMASPLIEQFINENRDNFERLFDDLDALWNDEKYFDIPMPPIHQDRLALILRNLADPSYGRPSDASTYPYDPETFLWALSEDALNEATSLFEPAEISDRVSSWQRATRADFLEFVAVDSGLQSVLDALGNLDGQEGVEQLVEILSIPHIDKAANILAQEDSALASLASSALSSQDWEGKLEFLTLLGQVPSGALETFANAYSIFAASEAASQPSEAGVDLLVRLLENPLLLAASQNAPDLIQTLLERSAEGDVETLESFEDTPLAAMIFDENILQTLLGELLALLPEDGAARADALGLGEAVLADLIWDADVLEKQQEGVLALLAANPERLTQALGVDFVDLVAQVKALEDKNSPSETQFMLAVTQAMEWQGAVQRLEARLSVVESKIGQLIDKLENATLVRTYNPNE